MLVQSRLDLKSAQASGAPSSVFKSATKTKYNSPQAAALANASLTDADGRVMVMVKLNGLKSFNQVRKSLKASVGSLTITAVDKTYKGGVIEGWVAVDDVPALAETWGVSSVMLEAKPEHTRISLAAATRTGDVNATPGQTLTLLGTAFDQGVTQHRVDQINKFYNPSAPVDYEGQGLSIACISDSFGDTTATTVATDVANFDLPGAASNPAGNTTPVTVLQDLSSGGTDEGRAMCQIVYKMAPKAAVGFATADTGEVGFANNIRALAGLPGYTFNGQTFAADVICDDVGYQDEPFFEDGIVGNAVDDVSAAGVCYFSSAGNDVGTYDYDADFRYVPNGTGLSATTNTALAGTNINLTNVPTALYQGGFHNFNPASGQQDVALTYNVQGGASLPVTNFQWNDPYDQVLSYNSPAIFTGAGTITASSGAAVSFTTPTLTAGQNYVILETADAGSTIDGVVTVTDPTGNVLVYMQDTGTDESVNLYPGVTGAYTITVQAYSKTGGAFHVNVYTGNNPQVTTDFNLLVFDLEGNYLSNSSLITNNLATNVPYDAKVTSPKAGETQVQYLVTRAAVPTAPNPANHFRILIRGNGLSGIGPAEYVTINTPNTKGHAMASSCNGTAAYSVFRPSVPEYFTSPGPATVYFDKQGNRLATPDVRLQPRIAAADAANTSFFSTDSLSDVDAKANFSGTSAAAPHAAACALLTLQAHGGHRSITPAQMTSLLERSTFPHDLDPNAASASVRTTGSPAGAGKVTITVSSDLGLNPNAGAFNRDSIAVSYVGAGSLATLTFNPQGTAATGGGTTDGNNGVDAANTYFSNLFPGLVFEPATIPFAIGSGSSALAGTTVAFSNQAPAPSVTGQFWTAALTFPGGAFTGGSLFRFTVGHGPQHNSQVSNGTGAAGGVTSTSFTQADLFGATVALPDGSLSGSGMAFSGTTSDGGTFSGAFKNLIGSGWSVTDGFGFINAQAAVSQTVQ